MRLVFLEEYPLRKILFVSVAVALLLLATISTAFAAQGQITEGKPVRADESPQYYRRPCGPGHLPYRGSGSIQQRHLHQVHFDRQLLLA